MKLLDIADATNPRRVTIYLVEKGIAIDRVQVDVTSGENRAPAYLALNPAGTLPVLVLDDGRSLVESAAIVEYLEELYPDPPMIGTDAVSRGRVRALERIAADLISRTALYLQHSHAFFSAKLTQQPAVATALLPAIAAHLKLLDEHLGDDPYLASSTPTIADCTLFALTDSCSRRFQFPILKDWPRLDAWHRRFATRPSAQLADPGSPR